MCEQQLDTDLGSVMDDDLCFQVVLFLQWILGHGTFAVPGRGIFGPLYNFARMTSGTAEGKGTRPGGKGGRSRPLYSSFLPKRSRDSRTGWEERGGVSSDTRFTASITILILSSYACRLEPLAQGKVVYSFFVSYLRSFILFIDITIFRFRKHFGQRFVEACYAATADLRILRSRYVV
jgi:hypothetical protein